MSLALSVQEGEPRVGNLYKPSPSTAHYRTHEQRLSIDIHMDYCFFIFQACILLAVRIWSDDVLEIELPIASNREITLIKLEALCRNNLSLLPHAS